MPWSELERRPRRTDDADGSRRIRIGPEPRASRLGLVGVGHLRVESSLRCPRPGLSIPGPSKDERGPNRHDRTEQRADHIHPVVREARPDQVGTEVQAAFIDAPEIGLPHNPARAMYAPTPSAPIPPRFWAPDAVPRMTLTSPNVRTVSIHNASIAE